MVKKYFVVYCVLFLWVKLFAAELQEAAPPKDSSQEIVNKITASKKPVLVDFWAPWCGPCRMLNPILKGLEKEYAGRILFLKVNVDVNMAIAGYFRAYSIPTVYLIKDKTVVNSLVGLHPKEDYQAALNEILKNKTPADSSATVTTKEKNKKTTVVKPQAVPSKSPQQ